ncbi:MAG: mucoidy inhibitor MuiA family protein [Pseudomonadota bacterium]
MVRILAAAALACTVSTAAVSATFEPDSTIARVIVFPSGAQVVRVAELDLLPGEHRVLVDDLPANIDPASIRVKGVGEAAVTISGVNVRTIVTGDTSDPAQRKALEEQINALNDEINALNQAVSDINTRRQLLQTLLQNAAGGRGEDGATIDASALTATLDVVAQQLDGLNTETTQTRAAQREAQEEMQDLQQRLAQLAPRQTQRTVVEISVSTEAETGLAFDIQYNVREAGWRAIYDAAISVNDGIDDATMSVTRRALVQQATAESWDDVALTLSTARPTASTAAPTLSANIIDERDQIALKRRELESRATQETPGVLAMQSVTAETGYAADAAEMAPAPVSTAEQAAVMRTGGFQATYEIAGKVSVSNAREEKSVLIGEDEQPATIMAMSVPRLDPAAYLVAAFTLEGEATYLPGEVLVTRDGTYLGRGRMPLLSPGDDHELGFGEDDFVTVERVERDRKTGETGILVSSNTETRDVSISVTNKHGFAMPVRIVDRLPVSDHEDIRVEALPGNTVPSETDLEGQRGVVAFDLTLGAGASEDLKVGYRVTWPSDMQISSVQ